MLLHLLPCPQNRTLNYLPYLIRLLLFSIQSCFQPMLLTIYVAYNWCCLQLELSSTPIPYTLCCLQLRSLSSLFSFNLCCPQLSSWLNFRPISKCQLNTLLCLHLIPIYLILSKGPCSSHSELQISHLEGGFTLRCLQRLSLPDLATLP